MAWLRESDTSANHPIVLAAHEMDGADDRILNELFGFVNRCATQSSAYEKDYIVTVGTARQMAGSFARYEELIQAAKFCGYFSEVMIDVEGEQRKAFKLVEDNDLFHMILKAERAWNNQRQKDNRDTAKTAKVRRRDGDACRYCGKSVDWNDRKSGRGGTYDHLNPGKEGTVETMVVCCKECNSRRQSDPEQVWELLPVPAEPLYGEETVAFLKKNGSPVEPSYTRTATNPVPANGTGTAVPLSVETPAVAAPDEGGATVATSGAHSDFVPDSGLDGGTAEAVSGSNQYLPESGIPADMRYVRSGFVGTGRDGPSREGTGLAGSGGVGGAPGSQLLSSAKSGHSHKRKRPRGRRGK